jgi:hypothetical protein
MPRGRGAARRRRVQNLHGSVASAGKLGAEGRSAC